MLSLNKEGKEVGAAQVMLRKRFTSSSLGKERQSPILQYSGFSGRMPPVLSTNGGSREESKGGFPHIGHKGRDYGWKRLRNSEKG